MADDRIQKTIGFRPDVWAKVEDLAAIQGRKPANMAEHIVTRMVLYGTMMSEHDLTESGDQI